MLRVIVAVTFSLVDDSLPRETCMYWGCQMHGPVKRRKPVKIPPAGWGFFPFFQMKFSKTVCWPPRVKFSSDPSEARTAVDFVYAKSQPFWLSAQFFFHWHHFYTCITFDPQWYCSSLTLAHFEWCLKHSSAILQLPAHNLILCDTFSSGALCKAGEKQD